MPPFTTFIGGGYKAPSPPPGQERLINWYVEQMESPGANSKAVLYPTPGVDAVATYAAAGGRANFTDDQTGRCFQVVGASFVETDSAFTVTVRGTVDVNANPATISTNGVGGGQLLITSGDRAYCYTLATETLTQVLAKIGRASC